MWVGCQDSHRRRGSLAGRCGELACLRAPIITPAAPPWSAQGNVTGLIPDGSDTQTPGRVFCHDSPPPRTPSAFHTCYLNKCMRWWVQCAPTAGSEAD